MAIVSSSVALRLRQPQMERRLVRSLEGSPSSRSAGSGGGPGGETEDEMVVGPVGREEEIEAPEKVFVAVGKDFKDGKTLISWVCQNTPKEKKIVLVHVHRPAQMIPMSKF